MRRARALWPHKTAAFLAACAGVEVRSAERWLSGTRELSADAVAHLLRSEDGLHFLAEIIGDARPRWWCAFHEMMVIADARKLQIVAQRRLQEALNADADLTAAISRAETLSDADFHRAHLDALRSANSVPDSAMDASPKRRR